MGRGRIHKQANTKNKHDLHRSGRGSRALQGVLAMEARLDGLRSTLFYFKLAQMGWLASQFSLAVQLIRCYLLSCPWHKPWFRLGSSRLATTVILERFPAM